MGLDQFAYRNDCEHHPEFIWRKHAKLQEFMEDLFVKRTGKGAADLNCASLELSKDDIAMLEKLVRTETLPDSAGGFFYGHQFQDESSKEYRDQDLAFCKWAKAVLDTREKVIYSCWW